MGARQAATDNRPERNLIIVKRGTLGWFKNMNTLMLVWNCFQLYEIWKKNISLVPYLSHCLFVTSSFVFHYPVTNFELSFRSSLVFPRCPVTEDFTCPKSNNNSKSGDKYFVQIPSHYGPPTACGLSFLRTLDQDYKTTLSIQNDKTYASL